MAHIVQRTRLKCPPSPLEPSAGNGSRLANDHNLGGSRQIGAVEGLEQRLQREEPHRGRGIPEHPPEGDGVDDANVERPRYGSYCVLRITTKT